MSPFGREAGVGSDGRGLLEMSSDERERSHLVRACVEARLSQREASERVSATPKCLLSAQLEYPFLGAAR